MKSGKSFTCGRQHGIGAGVLLLLVLLAWCAAGPAAADPARARGAHYSKAFEGVKADGLKDQRLWKFADFAQPLNRFFKANGTVDLALVTYRMYGPDVTNPPAPDLIRAAETVMQGMYEGFCNITAHVVAANSTPSAPLIRNPAERRLEEGSLVPVGDVAPIPFKEYMFRSVDITFFSKINASSSFPEITGTAQQGFLIMRGDAMRNLNFSVNWMMDITHKAQASGLPVISTLPLTPTETHWMTVAMQGPSLTPFNVEKQSALLSSLGSTLLIKTNVFRLTVERVDYFDHVDGYLDSINVTMLVSKYDSAFLPPLSEVLGNKGEGIMTLRPPHNRSVFMDVLANVTLDVRSSRLLSVRPYYGPPLTWPDAVHEYKKAAQEELRFFQLNVAVVSLIVMTLLGTLAWRYRNSLQWSRRMFGNHEVYMGPMKTRGSQQALLNRDSLKKVLTGASDVSRISNVPEPLWNEAEIKPDDVAIAMLHNSQPWILGSGSFGRVYKGVLKGIHEVAIKVFDIDSADFDITQSALSTEIAILRSCTNPHIVQFLGVSFKENEVWMVMEYMDGGNLFNALKSGRKNVRWHNGGRKIALDIAKGLAWLHSHDVIHLDIKSPNILLTHDGTAKLGDVGLSHRLQNGRTHATLVDVGTYDWCAPEIILYQQATVKSDIFSYGVVMWEIITGKPPSRGRITDVVVPDDCCQETANLLYRCLAEAPTSRPTAAEIIIALSDVLGLPHPMSAMLDSNYTPDIVVDVSTGTERITNNGDLSFTWRYQNSLPKVNPFAMLAQTDGGASSLNSTSTASGLISPPAMSTLSFGHSSIFSSKSKGLGSMWSSGGFKGSLSKALSARPSAASEAHPIAPAASAIPALAAVRSALPLRTSVPQTSKKAS